MLNSSSYSVSFPLQTAVVITRSRLEPTSTTCTASPCRSVHGRVHHFASCHSRHDHRHQRSTGARRPDQPDGGLSTTTTDTNGNYVLGILPGWSGTVVPSGGGFVFVPGSQVYTNVTTSISNQNYMAVITIAPAVSRAASRQPDDELVWHLWIDLPALFLHQPGGLAAYGDAFRAPTGRWCCPCRPLTTGKVLPCASRQLKSPESIGIRSAAGKAVFMAG